MQLTEIISALCSAFAREEKEKKLNLSQLDFLPFFIISPKRRLFSWAAHITMYHFSAMEHTYVITFILMGKKDT